MQIMDDAWRRQLFRHLGQWSWIHLIYQMNDQHLVIADAFFIKHLEEARPAQLKCSTATPANYTSAMTDQIKKVLVFCGERELAVVRELRAAFPKKKIVSGTYGLALVGNEQRSLMRDYQPSAGLAGEKPVLLLTSAYADGEFLAELLKQNGLPGFYEYLGRPFMSWLQYHEGFQISRFYDTVQRHYGKEGPLHVLAQIDVLKALFDNSSFTLNQFVRYLRRVQPKTIILKRRGKDLQAVHGQLLHKSKYRSIWTKKANQRLSSRYAATDLARIMYRQQEIDEDERMLDAFAEACGNVHEIFLEDIIEDQATSVQKVASFLEAPANTEHSEIDYAKRYAGLLEVDEAAIAYRRDLIDAIGVHAAII